MVADETVSAVREVLAQQARLPVDPESIGVDDNLFEAGMSSHASVNVMLALEDRFDIEFPDAMLSRSSFATIGAIVDGVTQLREAAAAG